MRLLLIPGLLFIALSVSAGVHNTILPVPQRIAYGNSRLPLQGLDIGFLTEPCTEDIYAARELAAIIEKTTGAPVRIFESVPSEASIVFERTGGNDPLPVPGEKAGPDSRESYKLKITGNQVNISARSSAGLFYGVQTLRQLIEGSGKEANFPGVEIGDWPSLVYRGFMMDMSHTQLPRIDEIKEQIDFLARWKANQYYFYSEASIELDGYPILMADARFTKEQVKEIIDYARIRHIDVIPNMELYGHLHDLFRLEHYSDLAVIPHGGEFSPGRPEIEAITGDWIRQISQLFPSPFFHIGFDETWLIEKEAKKMNQSADKLYLKMLNQTVALVENQGKTPLACADMMQKFPSIIPEISKNIMAVAWHYFPLDKNEYEPLLAPFRNQGINVVVQSAIINWLWVVPQFETSFQNTDLLIEMARKYNAAGFINSGWTDDTQTLLRLAFPDLAYGSIASWQGVPVDRNNFFHDYALAQYDPDLALVAEKAYRSLTESEIWMRKAINPTDIAFFGNPFAEENLKLVADNRDNLHQSRMAAEDAQIRIREALKLGGDKKTFTAMLAGAKMLDYLALKYMYAGEIADFWQQFGKNPDNEMRHWMAMEVTFKYHTRMSDMQDAIIETRELFQKAWLNEYTAFRLGVALGKYDLEFQYWLRMQRRMEKICRDYRIGSSLPALETLFD